MSLVYRAKQEMRQALKTKCPEIRFEGAWRLARRYPEAWLVLSSIVQEHDVRIDHCVFYVTNEGPE